jgi:hypothetical protein
MKRTSLSCFALAVSAAVALVSPARAQIFLLPSSWTNDFANANLCPPGNSHCSAVAAVPNFEAYYNGFGPPTLFEAYGRGGDGSPDYAPPFPCDPTTTCGSGSLPCCTVPIAGGMTPNQQTLSMDAQGVVWWVDATTHHIHYLLPGGNAPIDLDAAMGLPGNQWATVAAGSPNLFSGQTAAPIGQVWAIAPNGTIFALNGSIGRWGNPVAQGWTQIWGMASQVAFMNETNPNVGCGANWHVPWVVDSSGAIYTFVPSSSSCISPGYSWTRIGSGLAVGPNDAILGGSTSSPILYQWRRGQFVQALQPPLEPGVEIVTVGGQVGGSQVWITDTWHRMWNEVCGTLGC